MVNLFVAGLNYKNTPVEMREEFTIPEGKVDAYYRLLPFDEKILLSTCNRTEIVFQGNGPFPLEVVETFFDDHFKTSLDNLKEHVYIFKDYNALKHLCRVASGLDSAIIGETEIFGQMKEAYRKAKELKVVGRFLDTIFQKVFFIGKLVRTETQIAFGGVSAARAAIELAENTMGLEGKKILIIGVGKINRTAVRYLAKRQQETVFITNRTYEKAEALARKLHIKAVRFSSLPDLLATVDIVFSATSSPHYVLNKENVGDVLLQRKKPLLLIDMAVPRDIDPVLRSKKTSVYNIDDLKGVIDHNIEKRKNEAMKAEQIIVKELRQYEDKDWNEKEQSRLKTG